MKLLGIFGVVSAALLMSACNNSVRQTKQEAEASKQAVSEELELSGEQRFENVDMAGDVVINEKQYHYLIQRISSDDLPLVTGDFSNKAKFHDNTATLKITCGDREVFSKTYSKNDFSTYVDAEMMGRSVLRGFVYVSTNENSLVFAVAVGYPQDDEMFVPVLLKVKTDGSVSIEKDPMLDDSDRPSSGESFLEEGV